MANTVNLEAMGEYIRQNADQLFVKSTVGAKTLDYVDLMLNVKHKEALNYLDSQVVLKAAQCGWESNGSDTFAQRYIQVSTIEIEKEYCYYDFKQYVINEQMKFEAGRETLGSWEEKIANSNVEAIKAAVEDMVWKGNSGASVTGFLADAVADSAATVEFASGATSVEKIDSVIAAANARMLAKGVNVFLSLTDFRNYVMESNGTCCANRPILDAASETITYAGDSRVKLIPVLGLEGTGAIVAATPDALVYGTDLEGSETAYEWFFDKKDNKFLFRVMFNAGTAIRFVDEVIVGKAGE